MSGCGSGSRSNAPSLTSRAGTTATAPPGPPGPPVAGAQKQLFAPTSFWNRPLPPSSRPAPDSPTLVSSLVDMVNQEVAGHWGPWISITGFSTPIYTVPGSQPKVRVALGTPNPALQAAFDKVPVPPDARPADGSDAQMTIWQPSTDRLWEFWHMRRVGGQWAAQWGGAMRDVSRSPGYFDSRSWPGAQPFWGATATSLPLVGGLMRISELQSGELDHALALGLPRTRAKAFVWPAQRSDGNTAAASAIPEGTRFRIDPRLDLDSLHLPALTLMMARAVQRYGMVVRDTSGVVTFYAEDPTPATGPGPFAALFGNEQKWQLMAAFPWSHLQVVPPGNA